MRLYTRLLLSHLAPVLMVTFALGTMLVALVRISVTLKAVTDFQVGALRDEGALHAAAWQLDVGMRRVQAECMSTGPDPNLRARIERKSGILRNVLGESQGVPEALRDVARGYLAVADDALSIEVCDSLTGAELLQRRARLHEQITDFWVGRLDELHTSVANRDESARRIAVTATWVGILVAAASFLFALVTTGRLARSITRPLLTLATMTERVGRGDFRTRVEIEGPAEITALAQKFELMREQLEQLDSLKQGFLASVSHEMRTPLSKIREALALLADGVVGELEEKQKRVVSIAQAACEREIRTVTTLLDLSRLRAGSPIRMRAGVSIDSVIQQAVDEERTEATAKKVEVSLETEGEPPVGRLDVVLVERAIANLVRNAVSVSKAGQRVIVRRSIERPARTGPAWVRIEVVDEGPGVPEEIRDKVFDAFVTRAVPRSPKALGIGLGLALAKEIAVAHRGDLDLSREVKTGSTFVLRFPLDDGSTGASSPTEDAPVPARALPQPSTE